MRGIVIHPAVMAERAERITRLIEEKLMTPKAAAVVVDAAMFGIGCVEGEVRAKIQKKMDEEAKEKREPYCESSSCSLERKSHGSN